MGSKMKTKLVLVLVVISVFLCGCRADYNPCHSENRTECHWTTEMQCRTQENVHCQSQCTDQCPPEPQPEQGERCNRERVCQTELTERCSDLTKIVCPQVLKDAPEFRDGHRSVHQIVSEGILKKAKDLVTWHPRDDGCFEKPHVECVPVPVHRCHFVQKCPPPPSSGGKKRHPTPSSHQGLRHKHGSKHHDVVHRRRRHAHAQGDRSPHHEGLLRQHRLKIQKKLGHKFHGHASKKQPSAPLLSVPAPGCRPVCKEFCESVPQTICEPQNVEVCEQVEFTTCQEEEPAPDFEPHPDEAPEYYPAPEEDFPETDELPPPIFPEDYYEPEEHFPEEDPDLYDPEELVSPEPDQDLHPYPEPAPDVYPDEDIVPYPSPYEETPVPSEDSFPSSAPEDDHEPYLTPDEDPYLRPEPEEPHLYPDPEENYEAYPTPEEDPEPFPATEEPHLYPDPAENHEVYPTPDEDPEPFPATEDNYEPHPDEDPHPYTDPEENVEPYPTEEDPHPYPAPQEDFEPRPTPEGDPQSYPVPEEDFEPYPTPEADPVPYPEPEVEAPYPVDVPHHPYPRPEKDADSFEEPANEPREDASLGSESPTPQPVAKEGLNLDPKPAEKKKKSQLSTPSKKLQTPSRDGRQEKLMDNAINKEDLETSEQKDTKPLPKSGSKLVDPEIKVVATPSLFQSDDPEAYVTSEEEEDSKPEDSATIAPYLKRKAFPDLRPSARSDLRH